MEGTPKPSLLIGFSILNNSSWGTLQQSNMAMENTLSVGGFPLEPQFPMDFPACHVCFFPEGTPILGPLRSTPLSPPRNVLPILRDWSLGFSEIASEEKRRISLGQ